jgi:hypothetical protein
MHKILLAAVVMTGFLTLTTPKLAAAPSAGMIAAPAQDTAQKVDYRSNGHHWHHRSRSHGHWHYWN